MSADQSGRMLRYLLILHIHIQILNRPLKGVSGHDLQIGPTWNVCRCRLSSLTNTLLVCPSRHNTTSDLMISMYFPAHFYPQAEVTAYMEQRGRDRSQTNLISSKMPFLCQNVQKMHDLRLMFTLPTKKWKSKVILIYKGMNEKKQQKKKKKLERHKSRSTYCLHLCILPIATPVRQQMQQELCSGDYIDDYIS